MTDLTSLEAPAVSTGAPVTRRWAALAALALVQFMLVLDSTVVNVALPSIQRDLHFQTSSLAWVIDGYALMAGGLLLLGGRLGDLTGRRRMFLIGLVIFAVASALSGAAQSGAMLIASRFGQGIGEALAAPSALAIVAVMFTERAERTKALGIWGGLAGLGGTLGVVLSGVITSELDWRWIFFINLPIAAAALALVPLLVPADRPATSAPRLDVTGAVLVTASIVAVVAGLLEAARHSWGAPIVVAPLVGGLLGLIAFVLVEARAASPLIPLFFFANRTRVSANIATVFVMSAFFAMFFSLTLYMQQVLHYSALRTGLAYLPFGIVLVLGIGLATNLLPRVGVRVMTTAAMTLAAVGLFMLARVPVDGQFLTDLLPGMLVLALGNGMAFPTLQNAALHGVDDTDAGLASAVQATIQQLGGAVGLAVVVAAGTRHAAHLLAAGTAPLDAATDGFTLGLRIAAGVLVAGAVLTAVFTERDRPVASRD